VTLTSVTRSSERCNPDDSRALKVVLCLKENPRHGPPITATALLFAAVVALGALGLVLSARIDAREGLLVSALAVVSSLLGAICPRTFLLLIYVTGPILWGFGENDLLSIGSTQINLHMVMGFVFCGAFAPHLLSHDARRSMETLRCLLLTLSIVMLPPVFFASDLGTGGGAYLRILCPFFTMFATIRFAAERDSIGRYSKAMSLSLFSVAVLLCAGYVQGRLFVSYGGFTRIGGMHLRTPILAYYLVAMVALLVMQYVTTGKTRFFILLVPVAVCIYLTFVRTAWIGAAFIICAVGFLTKRSLLLKCVVALALVIALINLGDVKRLITRSEDEISSLRQADLMTTGRLSINMAAIEHYLSVPVVNKVFGIGLFRSLDVVETRLHHRQGIHNDYLQILIEAGILSFLTYLAIVAAVLRSIWKAMRRGGTTTDRELHLTALGTVLAFVLMGMAGVWYSNVLCTTYMLGVIALVLARLNLTKELRDVGLPA